MDVESFHKKAVYSYGWNEVTFQKNCFFIFTVIVGCAHRLETTTPKLDMFPSPRLKVPVQLGPLETVRLGHRNMTLYLYLVTFPVKDKYNMNTCVRQTRTLK